MNKTGVIKPGSDEGFLYLYGYFFAPWPIVYRTVNVGHDDESSGQSVLISACHTLEKKGQALLRKKG